MKLINYILAKSELPLTHELMLLNYLRFDIKWRKKKWWGRVKSGPGRTRNQSASTLQNDLFTQCDCDAVLCLVFYCLARNKTQKWNEIEFIESFNIFYMSILRRSFFYFLKWRNGWLAGVGMIIEVLGYE